MKKFKVLWENEKGELCERIFNLDDLINGAVQKHAGTGKLTAVRQFTGLKDSKGVDIYESDFISVSDPDKNHQKQEVVMKDGCFCGYSEKKTCKYTTLDVLTRAHSVEVEASYYLHGLVFI